MNLTWDWFAADTAQDSTIGHLSLKGDPLLSLSKSFIDVFIYLSNIPTVAGRCRQQWKMCFTVLKCLGHLKKTFISYASILCSIMYAVMAYEAVKSNRSKG